MQEDLGRLLPEHNLFLAKMLSPYMPSACVRAYVGPIPVLALSSGTQGTAWHAFAIASVPLGKDVLEVYIRQMYVAGISLSLLRLLIRMSFIASKTQQSELCC